MFKVIELLEATKGKLLQGRLDTVVENISTDTRTIKANELFIAINGERFNGHNFLKDTIRKKAKGVVISERNALTYPKGFLVILVSDTTKALADIANFHRRKFNIPIIVVTGSNGKTTTKDMIAYVLAKKYNVLSSQGTYNNHIGVPLTLLKLNKLHQIAVLELGTNHKGEIFNLSKIAMPDVAVFTNIGPSHLEFFKNISSVFEEKYSLIKNLSSQGYVVFNKDDTHLSKIEKKLRKKLKIISFGIKNKAVFRASGINFGFDSLNFSLNKKTQIRLNTPAEHNIYNALAAVACTNIFKIDLKTIKVALEEFKFPNMRFNFNKVSNFYLIDDSYNSNPVSLSSAIRVLSRYNSGKRILICGDMLELGKSSRRLHFDLGRQVKDYGIDVLITVGELSKWLAKGAQNNRLNKNNIWSFNSLNKATEKILDIVDSGDVILIKGSRLLKMEKIVEDIKKSF